VAILLDRSGASLSAMVRTDREPVLLFGPEGGIESGERDRLTAAGWQMARLAGTVLRFETAGIAALAVCRAQLLGENRDG
jgi:16S rRNA (uracil1498-N3)-methyltransferase